jgi:hypothetical protein
MRNALVAGHCHFGFDAGGAFDAKFHVTLIIRFGFSLRARRILATGDAQHRDNSGACPARLAGTIEPASTSLVPGAKN